MLAILNFLNAHNLPNFRPILIILVSKFIVHRALPAKTYSSLGLLLIIDVLLYEKTVYGPGRSSSARRYLLPVSNFSGNSIG